jgi:hypothetical protein
LLVVSCVSPYKNDCIKIVLKNDRHPFGVYQMGEV